MRGEPLACFRAGEAEQFEGRGGIEQRTVDAQPIVERIFGPANGALRAVRKVFGNIKSGLLEIGVIDA